MPPVHLEEPKEGANPQKRRPFPITQSQHQVMKNEAKGHISHPNIDIVDSVIGFSSTCTFLLVGVSQAGITHSFALITSQIEQQIQIQASTF